MNGNFVCLVRIATIFVHGVVGWWASYCYSKLLLLFVGIFLSLLNMLFNDAVSCKCYIVSVINVRMSMERWWNDIDRWNRHIL